MLSTNFENQFKAELYCVLCRFSASAPATNLPVLHRHVRGREAACTVWTVRYHLRWCTEVRRLTAFCDMEDSFSLRSRLLQAALTELFHLNGYPCWRSQVHSSVSRTRTGYLRLTASHRSPVHVRRAVRRLRVCHRSSSGIHSRVLL